MKILEKVQLIAKLKERIQEAKDEQTAEKLQSLLRKILTTPDAVVV
jgi:hypothetical protein